MVKGGPGQEEAQRVAGGGGGQRGKKGEVVMW